MKIIINSKKKISRLLKIKEPFLMIDNYSSLGRNGKGTKLIKSKDFQYKSHFINNPVFPGTLQIESMLQTIVVMLKIKNKSDEKNYMITKINTNLYSSIIGTGKLIINAKILSNKRGAVEAIASIKFKNKKVSEGRFRFFCPNDFLIK